MYTLPELYAPVPAPPERIKSPACALSASPPRTVKSRSSSPLTTPLPLPSTITSPLPCAPRYKSTSPEAAVFVERTYILPAAFVSFKPSPAPEVVALATSNIVTPLLFSNVD